MQRARIIALSSSEYRSVGRLFGVASNTVCKFLHEFIRDLIAKFAGDFMSNSRKVHVCVKVFKVIGFPQFLGAIGKKSNLFLFITIYIF